MTITRKDIKNYYAVKDVSLDCVAAMHGLKWDEEKKTYVPATEPLYPEEWNNVFEPDN